MKKTITVDENDLLCYLYGLYLIIILIMHLCLFSMHSLIERSNKAKEHPPPQAGSTLTELQVPAQHPPL